MRLKFHGVLKNLYGAEITMATDSVADAIEGFSRQQENWPRDLIVRVMTLDNEVLDTVDKLREHDADVYLMPAMLGGGGKFGTIIMGAVLIAAAFAFAPAAGVLTGAFSSSLLVAGGIMVLQGVVNLFMKAPKISKNNDPEASKYLAVNANTTQVGTPITLAWGTIELAGQWLSLQSDSSNLSFGTFNANP